MNALSMFERDHLVVDRVPVVTHPEDRLALGFRVAKRDLVTAVQVRADVPVEGRQRGCGCGARECNRQHGSNEVVLSHLPPPFDWPIVTYTGRDHKTDLPLVKTRATSPTCVNCALHLVSLSSKGVRGPGPGGLSPLARRRLAPDRFPTGLDLLPPRRPRAWRECEPRALEHGCGLETHRSPARSRDGFSPW